MLITVEQVAGVVLCGGKSSRMGASKATLPFGDEVMLQRVVRLLGSVVQPIVVVAADGQPLPTLPPATTVVFDERPDRGPLEGISAGLRAVAANKAAGIEAAYITSCDVPLLEPRLVTRLIELLEDDEIAVPVEDRFAHPLAAVYRCGVVGAVDRLRAADRMRPAFLFDEVATRRVPVERLRDIDPELDTLANLNDPSQYLAALQRAGFEPPEDVIKQLSRDPDS